MSRVSRYASVIASALFLLVAGCGKDEPAAIYQDSDVDSPRGKLIEEALASPEFQKACKETPGCADPPRFDTPPETETIWRVYVVREPSDAIRIDRVESVQVPKDDGVPVGPVSGSHLLVGLDSSGDPVDGQLISFPEFMRSEYEPLGPAPDEPGASDLNTQGTRPRVIEQVDLSDQEVGTVGFLRMLPTIQTVAVTDESGATLAEYSTPSFAQDRTGSAFSLIDSAMAQAGGQPVWPYLGNIPPYCAHVVILEGELDRALAQGIAYEDEIVELVAPGPTQRATIFAALRRMTPMLCQGVRRIALGVVPASAGIAGAVRTRGTGDMMLINVRQSYSETSLSRSYYRQLQMMGTIYHEAGHATDALINAQGSRPESFTGDWEMSARTMAAKTIDRVRLEKGLRNEWLRFHQSYMRLGWAQAYQSSDPAKEAVYNWSPQQVSDAGFMSHYGATSLWDDIAEMVEWAYVSSLYMDRGWSGQWSGDFACQEMRKYSERNLPSRFTTVYTKLMLLKDLGLVAEEDVETCMGPDIGLPINSGGFHFWHDGNMIRSFDQNLTATMGTIDSGHWVFEMEAEGEASFSQEMYPAKLKLRIGVEEPGVPVHLVPWPRGVYKLGLRGNNTLSVQLDGAPAGNINVKDGSVLVAEASNKRIAGSVFITIAMRLGAPLPVPQTWNPPLVIRFQIER